MSRTLPAVLLAAALGLAATGTAVAVRRSTTEGGPPADPRAAVVDALAAVPGGGAGRARYVVRYQIENPRIVVPPARST